MPWQPLKQLQEESWYRTLMKRLLLRMFIPDVVPFWKPRKAV